MHHNQSHKVSLEYMWNSENLELRSKFRTESMSSLVIATNRIFITLKNICWQKLPEVTQKIFIPDLCMHSLSFYSSRLLEKCLSSPTQGNGQSGQAIPWANWKRHICKVAMDKGCTIENKNILGHSQDPQLLLLSCFFLNLLFFPVKIETRLDDF